MIPDEEITALVRWLDFAVTHRVSEGCSDQPESDFYALAQKVLAERELLVAEHSAVRADHGSEEMGCEASCPMLIAQQAVEDFGGPG